MNTLFLDTHTDIIKMALLKDEKLVKTMTSESTHNHNEVTIPLLIKLLDSMDLTVHDIHQIVVVNGPGSFTGIRLGVTIAKTLAFTLNIPIFTISTLLLKALSFDLKENTWFMEDEKNGCYVLEVDQNMNVITDYFYIKKSEQQSFVSLNHPVDSIEISFEKIISYVKTLSPLNPHEVKPLYVKLIEVLR